MKCGNHYKKCGQHNKCRGVQTKGKEVAQAALCKEVLAAL